jgi:hypothetical protein
MRITRQISQQHLWVDVLCITHDKLAELETTLQQTHLLSGNALVTICAIILSKHRNAFLNPQMNFENPSRWW